MKIVKIKGGQEVKVYEPKGLEDYLFKWYDGEGTFKYEYKQFKLSIQVGLSGTKRFILFLLWVAKKKVISIFTKISR